MICDDRDKCWNLLLGFVCYLHKDGCLLLDLLFHFLAKRIKEVTFTAVFEHNSRIIIVEKKNKTKKERNDLGIHFKIRGVLQSHFQNLYIEVYIGSALE